MKVLHNEHHGLRLAERFEQRQERLEDARLGGLALQARSTEPGEDVVERGSQRWCERVERGVALADERAERTQERCVGKLVVAKLHAVAGEHAGARLAGVTLQLVREARLPDTRLTANQRERWPGSGRVPQRGLKLGELSGSTDEAGARHARGHPVRILPGGRRCR
jgi:hypothetical protein